MKKILILVFSLIFLMVGCGTTPTEPSEQEEPTISVVVNDQITTQEDEWDELEEGYELAVVNITITNNTDADYEFNPNAVIIQTDNEQIMVSDKHPKGEETLSSYNLEVGESLSGIVCFDIPVGAEYEIYYDDLNDNKFKL